MILNLTSQVYIEASKQIALEIERTCTFANPKFAEARKMKRSTRNIPRQIRLSERAGNKLIVPVGMLKKLLDIYPEAEVIDQRTQVPAVIPFTGDLRPYQKRFVHEAFMPRVVYWWPQLGQVKRFQVLPWHQG